MSQAGTPPRAMRKSSMSSLRSVANQSSPGSSPRRGDRAPSSIGSHSSGPLVEEPPPLTAASVASAYFAQELALHENEETSAQVAVILHDACYGHRFSRPKTSKGMLSMIVERPERVLAAVLGLCTAYVRLGSRHSGGEHAPHPDRKSDADIPFKIRKSARSVPLTSSFVSAVHGTEWMKELEIMCNVAGERLALHMKELARPETPGVTEPKDPFHEGDLYLCSESLNALQGALGGVCDAVDTIFSSIPTSPRRAFVAIRPPGHHCSSDFPSGFCWINNVHIGIEYAAQTYGLTHAVILDIDLHHGDGSQDITWERNAKSAKMPKNASFTKKTAIGYYSMHDINSYPCEDGDKEKVQNASLCIDNAHGQSIWNVHLEAWRTMDEFWALYETKYSVLLDKARTFLKRHTKMIKNSPKQAPPKAAIFISAGFDASQWEGAGMQRHAVNVPTEFYARFAKDVVKLAHEEGTGANGRVISVLEGGYSDRALCSGVLSHVSGLCQDPTAGVSNGQLPQLAADDIASALENMNISSNGVSSANSSVHSRKYDPEWWDAKNLQALETHVTPPPPPAPLRSQRAAMPTYATPTQSFTGKVVDPVKFQLTVSGTMRPMSPRPAGPREPPEVNWIVAVHELSKLVIPSDRQTRSHAPEDLAPQRVKKDRLSGPASISAEPTIPAGGRQLRARKTKTPETVSPPNGADDVAKPLPVDLTRRQTISELPSSQPPAETIQLPKRVTRRTSNMFDMEPEATDVPPVPTLPAQMPAAKTKKPRAPASKPTSPQEPVVKAEPQPLVKLENRAPRPEPRRFPSEPSVPSALPLTNIDYTRPINHIEPLRPAGIKRIHLKVGTREEHDRKMKEKELEEQKAREEAKSKPRKPAVSKAQKAVDNQANAVDQVAGAIDASATQTTMPAPAIVEQKPTPEPPAPAPTTTPSHIPDQTSPLYLDVSQPAGEPQHQAATAPFAPPPPQDQPLRQDLAHSAAPPPPNYAQQPDSQPQQPFFAPSYTHPTNTLPIFTSNGAIPFAPSTRPPRPSGVNPVTGHGNGVSRSMLENLPVVSKQVAPEDVDMDVDMDMDVEWDSDGREARRGEGGDGERIVPETPQH